MENIERNNGENIRNAAQEEELAKADSTMQENLAGQNIDARNTSEQMLDRALERERATRPHFERIIDSALEDKGGEFVSDIEQGGTMKLDPNQEI